MLARIDKYKKGVYLVLFFLANLFVKARSTIRSLGEFYLRSTKGQLNIGDTRFGQIIEIGKKARSSTKDDSLQVYFFSLQEAKSSSSLKLLLQLDIRGEEGYFLTKGKFFLT